MKKIKGLTINEGKFKVPSGKMQKVAIFLYSGLYDPKPILQLAISQYVGKNNQGYIDLISSELDNPWMRVIVENPNEMYQEVFNPRIHRMKQKRKQK
jgi:hypothetical protein